MLSNTFIFCLNDISSKCGVLNTIVWGFISVFKNVPFVPLGDFGNVNTGALDT